MRSFLLFLVLLLAVDSQAQSNEKPFVIPEVTSWKAGEGSIVPSGRILVLSKSFRPAARKLAEDFALLRGGDGRVPSLTVRTGGKPRRGDIVFICRKHDTMSTEGYQLSIGRADIYGTPVIEISSPGSEGALWATRTLLQLFDKGKGQSLSLPCGTIVDEPQYPLRGFMLDVGRKYIPMSYLRQLVKVMSYYKMNTLQLHLNDNGFWKLFDNDWMKTPAAFRLECDTYPGLTARDGSYTKAEFIELQQLAEQYGVEIIPEIDSPAHVLAFTHYRPEFGSKEYGMDHFDLSNPDIYPFMDNLFKEYLSGDKPVFRGPHVNIGTDEYSNKDQYVVEQFRAYTDHYLSLVESYGKKPMLWGALTHAKGQTPVRHEGVLMNCWYNGYAQPDSMKRLGYQLVSIPDGFVYIVPLAGYYNDYLNCQYLYEHWTPAVIGNQKFDERDRQIEGGMFAVWNDHIGNGITVKDIHHRVYPALQTMATKCWTGQLTSLPYAEFDKRRTQLSEAPGVNELGRVPNNSFRLAQVKASSTLPLTEAGYGYRISFDVDCVPEKQGTVLTTSPHATFYLSAPETGCLAFAHEGTICPFDYQLPGSGKVSLSIECTSKETRLYVDGQLRQTLAIQKRGSMQYIQTLCFPLERTGDFASSVTNLNIESIE